MSTANERINQLRRKYGIETKSKTGSDTSSRIAALREKYGLVQKTEEKVDEIGRKYSGRSSVESLRAKYGTATPEQVEAINKKYMAAPDTNAIQNRRTTKTEVTAPKSTFTMQGTGTGGALPGTTLNALDFLKKGSPVTPASLARGELTAVGAKAEHQFATKAQEQLTADNKSLTKTPEYQDALSVYTTINHLRDINSVTDEQERRMLSDAGFDSYEALGSYINEPGKRLSGLKGTINESAQNYYDLAGRKAVGDIRVAGKMTSTFDKAVEMGVRMAELEQAMKYVSGENATDIHAEWGQLQREQKPLLDALVKAGYDAERAVEYEVRQVREKAAAEESEANRKWAQDNKLLATIGSIATAPVQGLDYVHAVTGNLGHNSTKDIEDYTPLSAADMQVTGLTQDLREGVSADMGGVGKFLYNTGMSMADSALLVSTLGPGATVVMGMGAASVTAKDVVERGGTNNQALVAGLAAGVAETAFEKFSVDNLINMSTAKGAKAFFGNLLKQAGIEATEEINTELANILMDAAIMGQNSNFNVAAQNYMKQGMTEEQAKQQAFMDNLKQVALAGLGGFLSGGGMASVKMGGLKLVDSALNREPTRLTNSQAEQILANPTLMEQVGVVVTPDMTKSQQRAAVKQAAAQLASSQSNETAQGGAETLPAVPPQNGPIVGQIEQDSGVVANRIRQGVQAASVLGESGSKAFAAAYNADTAALVEPSTAFKAYTQTYNATMEGRELTADEKSSAAAVPQSLIVAARAAGERDMIRAQGGIFGQTGKGSEYRRPDVVRGATKEDLAQGDVTPAAQAVYNNAASERKVVSRGEEVHLRNGSQWNGSAYPGGQVSAVEESAGRNQGRQAEGRPADSGATALSYGEKVSTGSLGIGGGSSKNTVRILKGGDTQFTAEAKKLAKQRGLRVIFFAGDNLNIRQKDGQMASVRGYITGDRVFIRADHPLYTADQVMRHEVGHDMIAKGEINPDTVRERVAQTYGREKVSQLSQMYVEAYAGSGLTADEIWVEVVCDSLGDMNIFADTQVETAAQELLTETKKAATESRTVQNRGPPAAGNNGITSIETLPDGKKYVRADRQVIFGNDPDSWSEQLEDYINGKIRRGQDVQLIAEDGDILVLTAQTAGKISSPYRGAARMSDAAFERKVNAGVHIDELARVSMRGNRVVADEDAKHGESASDGWNYRIAYFLDFNEKYYECTISVSMGEGGNKVYNIGKMKERRFPTVQNALNGSSTRGGAQREKTSSDDSISKTDQNVNEGFTRELDSIQELREQNEALRKDVERWKRETQRTKLASVRQSDVDRVARRIVSTYDGTIAPTDISQRMKALGDMIVQGGDELTWSEVKEQALDIASDVVASAKVLRDDMYERYSDLRKHLRETSITVSREDSEDIPDFNEWRKHQFGRMKLSYDKTNVDQVYQELAAQWPEFFNEEAVSHPMDQIQQIADVLDSLTPVYENPYSFDMAAAAETVAYDIVDSLLSEQVRQNPATFADRQAAVLDRERAKANRRLEKVREDRDRKITELKQRQRERESKARESRNASAIRAKIQRHVASLSQKLRNPTDKKHVPETLRVPVAKLLESINLESSYTLDPQTIHAVNRKDGKSGGVTGKHMKDGSGVLTKRTQAFREIRLLYEKIANGEGEIPMVVDPDLLANLNELEGLRDVRIADMNTEQLQMVWDTVRAMEMSITNADKLFRTDKFKHVSEVAQEIKDTAAYKKSKYPVRFKWADRMLTHDMLDSLTWLHQLGEGGDAVYRILQSARDQKISILAKVNELVRDAIGDANVRKLEEKIHNFELSSGERVSMTTAQIMSLFELSKRKQAQNHIYKGGIRPEAVKAGALEKEVSTPEKLQVTPEDVAKIISVLTAEQVQMADALQAIMQGYLADIGNEASMEVYGYKKFNEENYFPISSDPHQIQDKIGDVLESGRRRPKSVAEWGSAKATVQNANNGLMVESIFDVFAQHAVDMSTYASHLAALEDVNRIRHFKWRDKDGTVQATMGGIIERLTGDKNQAYLNKLLQDISAGVAKNSVSGFGKLTANYKAASVGLNLRVAIQQPISSVWAFTVIDPKYLVIGLPKRGGWKKALKWAPIAQWKDWGNFEINQGRDVKDIFFDTDTALERVREKSMWLAGKMDSITWGAIWNACEAELNDSNKSLKSGTDEFYKAVAQRFTDIIDQTQVVDNVLGRSQIMRSGDELAKMATSFLGEPTRTYNLLYRTAQDYFGEQNKERRNAARKQLGRAVAAYTLSNFVLALAQSVVDAWRDDEDRERKYLERYVDNVLPNFVNNINLFSAIPYIKDVISILQGYEISRMDMDALTSLIQAGQNLAKTLRGEGKASITGATVRLLAEAARIFGISVANLKRDMLGITQSFLVETGNWELQYEMEKALNNITVAGSRSEIYKILMSALSDGDYDAYKAIAADMIDEGIKASTIEQGVRSAIATYAEKHKGFTIPEEAKALLGLSAVFPEDAKKDDTFGPEDLGGEAYVRYSEMKATDYSAIEAELKKSVRFNRLSNADKNRAMDFAEKIAKEFALESASAGRYTVTTKWISKADDAQRIGISAGEYILFHMAYNDASGEDKKEIVRDWLVQNSALNETQREFLWRTVYSSEF